MPAVIRTPGVKVCSDASFEMFGKPKTNEKRKHQTLRVIEGSSHENPAIGYEGLEDREQKFCLVVKDEKTGQVELMDVPLFDVKSYVKSLRESDAHTAIRQSGVQNWQQRTALGEAFGTKKAKTAITDVSRNRVDADMLDGLETRMLDNVKERTAQLPSSDSRNKEAQVERPIPPYNLETTDVAKVYPLKELVPPNELDLLLPVVEGIMTAPPAERLENLPYKKSDFVNARIDHVLADESNIKPRLLVLVYLSFLQAVFDQRRARNREELKERVGNYPQQLYNGVIERFTIVRAGKFGQSKDRSLAIDPYHADKLLSYILVLCLHANDFEADVLPLAHELSTKPIKLMNLFRNLGCTTRVINAAEAKARNLSGSQAATYRIATLSAPLRLPETVRRKRAN